MIPDNIPDGWRLLKECETPKRGDRYFSNGAGGGLWFPIEIRLPEDFHPSVKIIRYDPI